MPFLACYSLAQECVYRQLPATASWTVDFAIVDYAVNYQVIMETQMFYGSFFYGLNVLLNTKIFFYYDASDFFLI